MVVMVLRQRDLGSGRRGRDGHPRRSLPPGLPLPVYIIEPHALHQIIAAREVLVALCRQKTGTGFAV